MIENIRLAFQGIWSHKMRSFLTMLGIIIGIAAIIAIVSTIKGTNEQMKKALMGFGNNTVTIELSQGDLSYSFSEESNTSIRPVPENVKQSILDLEEVASVTTFCSQSLYEGVYYKNNQISNVSLFGVDTEYFSTCNMAMQMGRPFLADDQLQFRPVMIVDQITAHGLFGDETPIGKTVEISGVPFVVVGVVVQRTMFEPIINKIEDYENYYSSESSGSIYIPKASWPLVYKYDEAENVIIKAADTDSMSSAGRKSAALLNKFVRECLNLTEGSSSGKDISYRVQNLQSQLQSSQSTEQSMNRLLLLVAGIALVVGSIGVMNIMLVSVTERTAEIGLKKAIGARKSRILAQFLTEAAVLTSIGGVLGVGGGIAAAYIIHYFNPNTPVAIDVAASIVAVAFSMVIGIAAGLFPSITAANLDPIEALRRE